MSQNFHSLRGRPLFSGRPLPRSTLLAQTVDVGSVDQVPRSHVLLHAVCRARLLAARKALSGLSEALLEAVLLKFLERATS
jgi:hypothetical protein